MSSALDRIRKLLALTASPNANEARNAALLAAKLIREHGIELRDPAAPARRATPARGSAAKTPRPVRTPSSKRSVRAVTDAPSRIESPLGGECFVCGKRYRAGSEIFWTDANGGMHAGCFEVWARGQGRRSR